MNRAEHTLVVIKNVLYPTLSIIKISFFCIKWGGAFVGFVVMR